MRMATVAFLVVVATSRGAASDEGPPPIRIAIDNVLVGRINPLALADLMRVGVAVRLYRAGRPLLRDNFLLFAAAPRVTASSLRFGPQIELQPLSILSLRFTGELVRFWGIFDSVQSFASPWADWSDNALGRNGTAGRSYPTDGVHLVFEPTVQLRFGPIAVRDHVTVEFWSLHLRPGDTVFYEAGSDTLVPNDGVVLSNDVDLAWLTRVHLAVALRYSLAVPLYSARHYEPGDVHDPALNRQQRLGPALAYTFLDRRFTRFHSVTLFGVAAWYLEHRYRTGADVSAAVPYLLGGVSFQSDLLLAP